MGGDALPRREVLRGLTAFGLLLAMDPLDAYRISGVRYPWYAPAPKRRGWGHRVRGSGASFFSFSSAGLGAPATSGSSGVSFPFSSSVFGSAAAADVLGAGNISFAFSSSASATYAPENASGVAGSSFVFSVGMTGLERFLATVASTFSFSQAATGSLPVGGTYYIAPSGSDSTGSGSIGNPWRTIGKFHSSAAAAGDTLYCRGGTYQGTDIGGHIITKAGTTTQPITVTAYPGETPVFQGGSPTPIGYLMYWIEGSGYWTIDGLTVSDWRVNNTAVFTSSADTIGGVHHLIWRNMIGTMADNADPTSHFFYAGGNLNFVQCYGNTVDGVFGTNRNGAAFHVFHADGADNINVHHNLFKRWTIGIHIADANSNNVTIEHNTLMNNFTHIQVDPGGSEVVVRSNAGAYASNANIYDGGGYIDLESNNVWGLTVPETINADGTLPSGSPAIGAGHDGQNAGAF